MVGRIVWGAFLILVGAGMLIFNKRYAQWAAPLMPARFNSLLIPRFLSIVVGVIMVLAGGSSFIGLPPR